MRVLALAEAAELERAWAAIVEPPPFERVRGPETGLVLVRGRIGGSGAPFNLGEMTVTRCSVQAVGGAIGSAWAAGRDPRRVDLAARFDALLQDRAWFPVLDAAVLRPLAAGVAARQSAAAAEVAATRVDFFTVVRGEG